ncbi:hypothetical protein SSX86_006344 [Deinandra increscens subsp. villosa]|uniref:CRM domain-containing protein n=1 Tax=Deinandra increscens subsp. villosa TaxID=3103831 RepID=A0AAP0DEL9_9ASTR
MALTLKTVLFQFPIFAPPSPHQHRPATEIRLSRWNNANAQKFIRHERTQKETEDQLRFHKRFESAERIASLQPVTTTPPPVKSTGTPSAPSRSSIPGKKSKYSKPPQSPPNSHPAFKRIVRVRKIPNEINDETGIKVGDNGLSYLVPEAPFEFQYSYTETPKIKPLKLREPPIAPFGPGTMPRPWTGKKPLAPSKKKVDFDSFTLPPPHKKGVKPVQAPGPFLPGSGPKYVQSREEVLGEPLTKEEIDALVKGCLKSTRQLNMGRDGLTHNMLDNIHAHWKRRRVCKIKCKGVCTVDMDNVRQQLEEKTGGKVIYSKGGVVYLFRGRNYNYKTRPVFPLMLWKPITPVYPRLIQRVPEGLTLEEASEMRKKGRELIPICKLGKNGVYCDLVNSVREAFEACNLVRINCQGMNGSDYRKIGAKLKDMVPCVLISFEHEHVLVWRGHNWKSMFTEENKPQEAENHDIKFLENEITTSTLDNIVDDTSTMPVDIENSVTENTSNPDSLFEDTSNPDSLSEDRSNQDSLSENKNNQDSLTGVMSLFKQAVEDGIAYVLEDSYLDADVAYAKAVAFSKSAQPGPTFRHHRPETVEAVPTGKQEDEETVRNEVVTLTLPKKGGKNTKPRTQKKNLKENYLDIAPQATLRVDELAKLLGRDGLTHNMLDNIHAHWKRRRVCKIKCKGVCTVDMDNVRQQLEEKTGGKVIYSKGGVVYLFRGRNYNYKTRPVFPLMLWKPITPVYPRLIQRVPEGLTLEEASEMRKKGRELIPICKLGKNGVYCDLVNSVREAFEACNLVRINCQGMNGSDYRKIGAKLKDMVPCVLISFEHEHVLVWRGHNWKSMFTEENKPQEAENHDIKFLENEITTSTLDNIVDDTSTMPVDIENSVTENTSNPDSLFEDTSNPDSLSEDRSNQDSLSENKNNQDSLTGVMSLFKQAVEDGIAYVLEDSYLDADVAYAKAVAFSKSAQPGPTFRHHRPETVEAVPTGKQEDEETVRNEVVTLTLPKKGGKNTKPRTQKKNLKENYLDIAPQATLRVDELAKLLG